MTGRQQRSEAELTPGVRIRIDRRSASPPFAQLVNQIGGAIDRGALPHGSRMPTVRALALDLGLVPNTVAKAFRELVETGYLEGRGRAGTFVSSPPVDAVQGLMPAARAFVAAARRGGSDDREAIEAVRAALRRS